MPTQNHKPLLSKNINMGQVVPAKNNKLKIKPAQAKISKKIVKK